MNLLKHFKVNYIVQFASVPVIILYNLEVYAVCKYYMMCLYKTGCRAVFACTCIHMCTVNITHHNYNK